MTRLAVALTLTAASLALGACGEQGADPGATSPTVPASPTTEPGPSGSTTVTTATANPTTTFPAPTLPRPKTPDTTLHVPPPAKDPFSIPATARDYAAAFVQAWLDRNTAHLQVLGTASAVESATDAPVGRAPVPTSCEGAAGSTYCSWQGDGYTLTVRVTNETAAQRRQHAVTEVELVR